MNARLVWRDWPSNPNLADAVSLKKICTSGPRSFLDVLLTSDLGVHVSDTDLYQAINPVMLETQNADLVGSLCMCACGHSVDTDMWPFLVCLSAPRNAKHANNPPRPVMKWWRLSSSLPNYSQHMGLLTNKYPASCELRALPKCPLLSFLVRWRNESNQGEGEQSYSCQTWRGQASMSSVRHRCWCSRDASLRLYKDKNWPRFALISTSIYCLNPAAFSGTRGREKGVWRVAREYGKWEHKSSEWDTWVSKQNYALNLTISIALT